jgi:hypothetical protein
VITLVVVSERVTAQTDSAVKADMRWQNGVAGRRVVVVSDNREVTKRVSNRTALERQTIAGDSPVGERCASSF